MRHDKGDFGNNTFIEVIEGMKLDRGFISPYFCTDVNNMTIEMENPYILVYDKKITSAQEILPLLQHVSATSSELLIIADDIESDALSTLIINKLKNILKVAAIKAPHFGENRKNTLEDIALFTHSTFVCEEQGLSLKEATFHVLGRAERVTITKEDTTIRGGTGDKTKIQNRIFQIEKEIEKAENRFDKKKLEERKAKLQQKVALIHVGGASDEEVKQKKHTYENSLNATQAAIKSGVVVGGGISFLKASEDLKLKLSEDEMVGVKILKKACQAPFKQIVDNAGLESSLILEKVLSSKEENIGFNVSSEKLENLMDAKIIDPLEVVKSSLSYAVSAASLAILSDVLIADAKPS